MEDNKTYEQAAKDALENFDKIPEAEVKKEVVPEVKIEEVKKEEVKEPVKEIKTPETTIPEVKEVKVTPKVEEEISPERLLKELNKLEFKVRGQNKTILSNEELKRLINLGFNYEENARKLNEDKQKLKEQPTSKEEVFVDYDEKQKQIEEKVKAIDEYISKITSKESEKELDMAIADLKESFPSITNEELDAINLETQNRLDLIPQGKEVDLKSLMHSIYLEFNPDAFNKKMQTDIDKKVQEKIDEYKKSLSKTVVTEGGSGSGGSKSVPKSPTTWDETKKLMEENSNL